MSNVYEFRPTVKQDHMFNQFGNSNRLEIMFGGAAGGGKSFALWSLFILKAIEFPGIVIGLARQTLTQIKQNSIATFYEVCSSLGINETHYKYNDIKGKITFYNGSVIQFFELRFLPTDPFYDRFGGALLTFGGIEEAAGVEVKGKEIFSSRLGRWMNDKYNIPPHLFITTNPGTNFVYSDFYIPWLNGTLEEHRYYIPATLNDNKYQSKFYADSLYKRLNKENADRLLNGDWNFDGDTARLMNYNSISDIFILEDYNNIPGEMYLSADIAFTGDRCIILLWKGLTVFKIISYGGGEPEIEIERLCKEWNIKGENVCYDSDGVGKYLKKKLPKAYDIINNSRALYDENYDNLKTQLNFKLAEYINNGKVKCSDLSLKEDMIQELYEIKSPPLEDVNGKLKIVSKKEVKKVIGRSPDISDAMSFRMVFEIKKPVVRPFAIRR